MQVLADIWGERFELHSASNDWRGADEKRLVLTLKKGVEPKLPTIGYGIGYEAYPCWVRFSEVDKHAPTWSLAYFHAAPLWVSYDNADRAVITLAVASKIYWRHYDAAEVRKAIRKQYRAVSGELVQRD